MTSPERLLPRPALFSQSSPLSAPHGPTAANSTTPELISPGCVFLRPDRKPGPFVPPAPDKLIVGQPSHKKMVMDLQKKFSNQLGFLPGKAIEFYLEAGHVGIALDNGEPCGYVLGRPRFRYEHSMRPITQAAVFLDAQRRHHGIALIEGVCRRAIAAGQLVVQCSCVEDIEAVDFWLAAGFYPTHMHTPDNARKRKIIVFRRALTETVPDYFFTPPPAAGHKGRLTNAK